MQAASVALLFVAHQPFSTGNEPHVDTNEGYNKLSKKNKRNNFNTAGELPTGVVVSIDKTGYSVRYGDRQLNCIFRRNSKKAHRVDAAIGDRVRIADSGGQTWFIEEVLQRKSELWRSDPRPPHNRRVIAANVDLAVILTSIRNPPMRLKLIDRYLIAAQMGGVEPLVCVNKIDLLEAVNRAQLDQLQQYREIGIRVVNISTVTGEGLDELRELMAGKTCVLVGHSGVGKSSILNTISPTLNLATNSPRKSDGKGRHTTTASNLYQLHDGISIIDTPGIREFGLHGIGADDLRLCFPEFEKFAVECAYSNCSHSSEPDCGVQRAVRDGLISRLRYESYLRLIKDIAPIKDCRSDDMFDCVHCGAVVHSEDGGTEHRNHCPRCLWSVHLDNVPGDRAACCGGSMEPVAVWVRKGGEWAIIQRCLECGMFKSNRIAADDNEILLVSLAVRPLAQPPFPLDKIAE